MEDSDVRLALRTGSILPKSISKERWALSACFRCYMCGCNATKCVIFMEKLRPTGFPSQKETNTSQSTCTTCTPWIDSKVSFNFINFPSLFPHAHDYYEIFVVVDGFIEQHINGQCYTMKAGDCCLIRPDDNHYTSFGDNNSSSQKFLAINFWFTADYAKKLFAPYSPEMCQSVMEDINPLVFYLDAFEQNRIMKNCLMIQSEPSVPTLTQLSVCTALINSLIHSLIIDLCNRPTHIPQWIKEFQLMLQDPDNFSKNIPDLVGCLPYSYSSVTKQFKYYVGTSIISYVTSVKMNHAKHLLRQSNLSMLEIAAYLGYDSLSHLNHQFKKSFGITPTAFRNKEL